MHTDPQGLKFSSKPGLRIIDVTNEIFYTIKLIWNIFGVKLLEILTGNLLLNLIMFYWASPDHFIGSDLVCFFLLMVSLSLHQRFLIFFFVWIITKFYLENVFDHFQSSQIFSRQSNKSIIFGFLCLETSCHKLTAYLASRSSVSLVWFLAFTKSVAWLVCRVL